MAHTPGPWKVDDHGFHKENGAVLDAIGKSVCPHCRKPGYDVPVTMQVLAKGWGVAQLGSYSPAAEYEQHLANARLIAAAPELLEACQHVVGWVGVLDERLTQAQRMAVKKCQQAIAKAEGR